VKEVGKMCCDTRYWIERLHEAGFSLKRTNGGHARFINASVAVDIPIHKKAQSMKVVMSLKRSIRKVQENPV
jgi:hypothetical protein